MLKFNSKTVQELELELVERSNEIAIETVKGILLALEQDVDAVLLGIIPAANMDITIKKKGFLAALQTNLQKCSDAEEFELCNQATAWIKKLKETETNNQNSI